MPGRSLSVVIGTDRDFPMLVVSPSGTAATGLSGSDTLSAVVWSGGDSAPLFSPAAVWRSATAGTYTLTFLAAQTLGMAAGNYRVQVFVTRSGKSAPVFDGWLILEATAGAAVMLPTYGTVGDVRLLLPYGDQYQSESDYTGFALQRGKARQWLDGLILSSAGGGAVGVVTPHHAAILNYYGSALGRSALLVGYLAANKLIVTPPIAETVARYAAHLVLKSNLPRTADDPIRVRAAELYLEAQSWASRLVCEIDLNGDGFGEWAIPLSITNTRYA